MRLLITGAWQEAKQYIPLLQRQGHEIAFLQVETDELPCAPEWAEGVICNALFLNHDIRLFTSLRYIQLTSAGLDRVPAELLRGKGISLYNARGVYSIPMAEHALMAVLDFYRNSRSFFRRQEKRCWEKIRDIRELNGSTVCILGCGSVGTQCAKRFAAMGCEVIGVDIQLSENNYFKKIYSTADIYRAVSCADVVIITLPLTEQTEGLADERFFAQLKPGCVLVNIARGRIIRTEALIAALREKTLYAALDVFEEEPLHADSPLWSMDNVTITPHNSFVSNKTGVRLSELILGNLDRYAGDTQHENIDHIPKK